MNELIWELFFEYAKRQYLDDRTNYVSKWYNDSQSIIMESKDFTDEQREQLLVALYSQAMKKLQQIQAEDKLIDIDKELAKELRRNENL